jgi:type II secretory pathway pseudopilin PulG
MTLVELLVAISILVILMAVGVRVMQFSVEDRRTREAARAINVYFSSSRNRAMETGRPCGVMLRRLSGQPLCAVGLEQVEVPPAYAGETLDSTAQLQVTSIASGLATVTAQLTPAINVDLVSKDDLVQFNCQGPLYKVNSRTDTSLTLQITLLPGQMLPWPKDTRSLPIPYQVFRQPGKSAAAGLQLPVRAVIDLEFSGTDDDQIGAVSDQPVYIMFSPSGALDRFYHPGHGGEAHPGTEPIYLLVGKQERVPPQHLAPSPAEDGLYNWQDVKNFWVTLNPQTGLVTTTEVARVDPTITDPVAGVPLARQIAREGQSTGGR